MNIGTGCGPPSRDRSKSRPSAPPPQSAPPGGDTAVHCRRPSRQRSVTRTWLADPRTPRIEDAGPSAFAEPNAAGRSRRLRSDGLLVGGRDALLLLADGEP